MLRRAVVVAVALMLASCTSDPGETPTSEPGPTTVAPTSEPSTSVPPTSSPTAEPTGPRLAGGQPLPADCSGTLKDNATATFVALGRAWAIAPNGRNLACLFEVGDPGPFEWGPLGDRALLADLQVVGLGGAPSLDPAGVEPVADSWSFPTGKAVAFIPPDPTTLEKLHLEDGRIEDISPVTEGEYVNVAYHPSGLALGFAVRDPAGDEALWLSRNTGAEPQRVVFSEIGTLFGAMAFSQDGTRLIYAALHTDGHTDLHTIDLTDTSRAPVLYATEPGGRIQDIRPGATADLVAFTTGTSCDDGAAMVVLPAETGADPLLPDATVPTRAVGWLDDQHVLVSAGGCDSPLDLYSVSIVDLGSTPLVLGMDAAGVRTPARTPAPPLPAPPPPDDSGFA
jgi:hypothetical protein